jgi:hypothetical protein
MTGIRWVLFTFLPCIRQASSLIQSWGITKLTRHQTQNPLTQETKNSRYVIAQCSHIRQTEQTTIKEKEVRQENKLVQQL